MKLKWNLVLLFTLSLVMSCGQQANEDEEIKNIENVNILDWETPMRDEALLTEDEFNIAKNICSSFQNMRAFLASQSSGLDLDFRVEIQSCGSGNTREHTESAGLVYSRATGVSMTTSRSSSLATDVLSDQHIRLSNICSDVLSGSRPSNMLSDGELRYQVNFFTDSSFEWIQIAEFKKNSSGVYYPYLIEKAGIVTEMSSAKEEALGFTKYRGIHRPCSNNTNSYTLQEWL